MAVNDGYLRSVPSDSDRDDGRLYDPTVADGSGVTITADLAATEAQDVAAFSAVLVHVATFAVSEASDTAAFSAALVHAAALAATEGQDVAAFSGALVHVADLAATEAQDVASFTAGIVPSSAEIDRGAKLRKYAKEQRYIYRKERIEREVPEPVAEAIERVVEHFEETASPSLGQAAALLALELDERGVAAAQNYTDILLSELAKLREAQEFDDDEEISAVLIELLK